MGVCGEEKKGGSSNVSNEGRENEIEKDHEKYDEPKDNNINNTENINLDSMAQNSNRDSNNNNGLVSYNIRANRNFNFTCESGANLVIHKNDGMNDFVVVINLIIYKNFIKRPEFIMILDKSGSMKGHVHRLVSKIIPNGLKKLNYSDNDKIHLITFDSSVNYYIKSIKELRNDRSLEGKGSTLIAKVYDKIKDILRYNPNKKNYRILILSDGKIQDKKQTIENASDDLLEFIKKGKYLLSVGAIRYNSGNESGDTSAICSILRLNTDDSKERLLSEVSYDDSDEYISQKIYSYFNDDYFQSDFSIKSNKIKIRLEPWGDGSNEVRLRGGKNILFLDKNPSLENIGIYEGGVLKYTKADFKNGYKLNYSNYNEILGAKITMAIRKVRINKTLGSKMALAENQKIINYFENFEKRLEGNVNKEALIAKELKKVNNLDLTNYNDNQLAQFIGVDGKMVSIEEFLKKFFEIDENEKKEISEFVGEGIYIAKRFDMAFNKMECPKDSIIS